MISFFRRWLSSWIFLGILGLVLVAFIITGVDPMGGGAGATGGGPTIAKAGAAKVSARDLLSQVQNQFDNARREQPGLDQKAFLAGGAFEDITNAMIAQRALEAWGHEQGLAIGKRLIDAQIANMAPFRSVTGQFDPMVMRNALAQARITEQQLRSGIASDLMRDQMLIPLAANMSAPAKLVRPYANVLVEERKGLVAIIPFALLVDPKRPTDAEIAAAYKAGIARYTRPEARILRYALFGPAQVAAQAVPTEADIVQYHREHADLYGARETRDLGQVITPNEATARGIAAAARSGGSLSAAARKAGLEAVTLTKQNRAGYAGTSSDAIAGQAFSAAKGAVIGPVKGAFGWYVVRVEAVAATPGRSLAEVRPEIVAALGKQKADEALSDYSGKIEDDIADGASFAEVVAKNKLAVVETPPLLSTGQAIDRAGWQAPAELSALLKPGFDATADDRPTVETVVKDKSFALLSVAKIVPPAPIPLAEVRGLVARDIILKRAAQRADRIAKQITAAVNRGVPLAKAMADSGARLPPPQPAAVRQIDAVRAQQSGAQVPPPVLALFNLQKGKAKLVPGDKGDVLFVTVLTEVNPGNPDAMPGAIDGTRRDLSQAMTGELNEQFMRSVQDEIQVKRYPDAIAAAKRQFSGAQ